MKNLANIRKGFKKLEKIPKLKRFIENQIVNCDTSYNFYSIEDKLFAYPLYLRDPVYYEFLRSYFSLPSRNSLHRILNKFVIIPGIIDQTIKCLEILMQEINTQERLGILVYQEINVTPHLQYDTDNDYVWGFIDDGSNRSQELATVIQVYMLVSLLGNWNYLIGYNYCTMNSRVDGICRYVKDIVKRCRDIDLRVVGIVNDPNETSVEAMNLLKNTTDLLKEIAVIYEPMQLVKIIRNQLMEHDVKFYYNGNYKVASWSDIVLTYNLDTEQEPPYKFLPKITQQHLLDNKMDKNKNSLCLQVFSLSMAKAINYYWKLNANAEENGLEEKSLGTRDFCQFMNDLNDSFHAEYNNETKSKQLRFVTNKSCHMKFWRKAVQVVKSMEFLLDNDYSQKLPVTQQLKRTIEGFLNVSDLIFNKLEFPSLPTKYFSHESLDHFMKQINDAFKDKESPLTCSSFSSTLKHVLTISYFATGKKSNSFKIVRCLEAFKKILEKKSVEKVELRNVVVQEVNEQDKQDSLSSICDFIDKEFADSYLKCDVCLENFKKSSELNDELKLLKIDGCEKLFDYSSGFLKVLFKIYKICNCSFPDMLHEKNLLSKIKLIVLDKVDFEQFKNCEHLENNKNRIATEYPQLLLLQYVKKLNEIIDGNFVNSFIYDNLQQKIMKFNFVNVKL